MVGFLSLIAGCSEDGASADTGSTDSASESTGEIKMDRFNYAAIEAYVTGKMVAELEELLEANSPEEMVDVVSGATLVDTYGYVAKFVEAATAAK